MKERSHVQRFSQTLSQAPPLGHKQSSMCFVHKLNTCPGHQRGEKQYTAAPSLGAQSTEHSPPVQLLGTGQTLYVTNNSRSLEEGLADSLGGQEGIREEVTSELGFGGQVTVLQQSIF